MSGKSLSHWNIGIPSCIGHIADYSPTQGYDTTDGSTDFDGIKWDVEESFTSGTFSITLDADYPETTILAKAGSPGNERTGDVMGPNCSETLVTAIDLSSLDLVIPPLNPACNYIYAVHDGGLNDSQLLRYSEQNGIEPLGNELTDYDIEALDISPDGELFGAAGDDTDKPGYLYTFDMDTGAILSENPTGCNELDGISFHPDGSLWGWDQSQGLVEIIDGVCSPVIPINGLEVEDLTWNNAGDTLYFAYNDHNGANPDRGSDGKATHQIGKLNLLEPSVDWNVCDVQTPEIEAIEVLNDDTLLVGYHEKGRQLTALVDLSTCEATGGVVGVYDIEGIGACPVAPNAAQFNSGTQLKIDTLRSLIQHLQELSANPRL